MNLGIATLIKIPGLGLLENIQCSHEMCEQELRLSSIQHVLKRLDVRFYKITLKEEASLSALFSIYNK